jgi:hypothetical protein
VNTYIEIGEDFSLFDIPKVEKLLHEIERKSSINMIILFEGKLDYHVLILNVSSFLAEHNIILSSLTLRFISLTGISNVVQETTALNEARRFFGELSLQKFSFFDLYKLEITEVISFNERLETLKQQASFRIAFDHYLSPLLKNGAITARENFLAFLDQDLCDKINTLVCFIHPWSVDSYLSQIKFWRDWLLNCEDIELAHNFIIPSLEKHKSPLVFYIQVSQKGYRTGMRVFDTIYEDFSSMGSVDEFIKKIELLQIQQYQYARLTFDCKDCGHLNKCVNNNTLSFMEQHNIQKCVYGNKLFLNT